MRKIKREPTNDPTHSRPNHPTRRYASMKPPPAWHAEARAHRALGRGPSEISQLLGKSHAAVRWALNENSERDAGNNARRARLAMERSTGATPIAPKVREKRAILADPVTKMEALALFAAGKIDRSEMLARITVGKPVTSLAHAGVR